MCKAKVPLAFPCARKHWKDWSESCLLQHRCAKTAAAFVHNEFLQVNMAMRIGNECLQSFSDKKICQETFLEGQGKDASQWDEILGQKLGKKVSVKAGNKLMSSRGLVSLHDAVWDKSRGNCFSRPSFCRWLKYCLDSWPLCVWQNATSMLETDCLKKFPQKICCSGSLNFKQCLIPWGPKVWFMRCSNDAVGKSLFLMPKKISSLWYFISQSGVMILEVCIYHVCLMAAVGSIP